LVDRDEVDCIKTLRKREDSLQGKTATDKTISDALLSQNNQLLNQSNRRTKSPKRGGGNNYSNRSYQPQIGTSQPQAGPSGYDSSSNSWNQSNRPSRPRGRGRGRGNSSRGRATGRPYTARRPRSNSQGRSTDRSRPNSQQNGTANQGYNNRESIPLNVNTEEFKVIEALRSAKK